VSILAKLNLAIFGIIAVLLGALAALVLTGRTTAELNDLDRQAERAVGAFYETADATKIMLITQNELEAELEYWNEALDAFESQLLRLSEHPALSRLDPELLERVERVRDVWGVTSRQFNDVRERLERIIDDPPEEIEEVRGIIALIDELEEAGIAGSMYGFAARQVEERLRAVDLVARDFIDSSFSELQMLIREGSLRAQRSTLTLSLVVGGLVLVGAFAFVLLFGRSFTGRIRAIQGVMADVARQDLTVRARDRSSDEIGRLAGDLNTTLESLSSFVGHVHVAAHRAAEMKESLAASSTQSASAVHEITKNIEGIREQLEALDTNLGDAGSAVSDIAAQVDDLGNSIEVQSRAIGESSSSIEQMNASLRSVADLAGERRTRSEELARIVQEGGERVESTNEVIRDVSREIDDILEIIEIINAVSEQTDLLSMNAAIESAHAGEAGKGFAVVAEEIRKLAESTSENAARIDRMLKSMTRKIKDALFESDQSLQGFDEISNEMQTFYDAMAEISSSMNELSDGSRNILRSTQMISEITENVELGSQEMGQKVDEIRGAMQASKNVSEQVVQGIGEIESGSTEILEAVNDTSTLSEESRERMSELREIVEQYKTDER
jgi:methyl-accepting chemotaxis protein